MSSKKITSTKYNTEDRVQLLDSYIYDYLLKHDYHETAATFLKEAKIPSGTSLIEYPGGALLEWWSVFWDIYTKRHSVSKSTTDSTYSAEVKSYAPLTETPEAEPDESLMTKREYPGQDIDKKFPSLNTSKRTATPPSYYQMHPMHPPYGPRSYYPPPTANPAAKRSYGDVSHMKKPKTETPVGHSGSYPTYRSPIGQSMPSHPMPGYSPSYGEPGMPMPGYKRWKPGPSSYGAPTGSPLGYPPQQTQRILMPHHMDPDGRPYPPRHTSMGGMDYKSGSPYQGVPMMPPYGGRMGSPSGQSMPMHHGGVHGGMMGHDGGYYKREKASPTASPRGSLDGEEKKKRSNLAIPKELVDAMDPKRTLLSDSSMDATVDKYISVPDMQGLTSLDSCKKRNTP